MTTIFCSFRIPSIPVTISSGRSLDEWKWYMKPSPSFICYEPSTFRTKLIIEPTTQFGTIFEYKLFGRIPWFIRSSISKFVLPTTTFIPSILTTSTKKIWWTYRSTILTTQICFPTATKLVLSIFSFSILFVWLVWIYITTTSFTR